MYLSLIVTFMLILILVISSVQNSMSFNLKFIAWSFQLTVSALILYSALLGAAIVAILTLPKLVYKQFKLRRLNKELKKYKPPKQGSESSS